MRNIFSFHANLFETFSLFFFFESKNLYPPFCSFVFICSFGNLSSIVGSFTRWKWIWWKMSNCRIISAYEIINRSNIEESPGEFSSSKSMADWRLPLTPFVAAKTRRSTNAKKRETRSEKGEVSNSSYDPILIETERCFNLIRCTDAMAASFHAVIIPIFLHSAQSMIFFLLIFSQRV